MKSSDLNLYYQMAIITVYDIAMIVDTKLRQVQRTNESHLNGQLKKNTNLVGEIQRRRIHA